MIIFDEYINYFFQRSLENLETSITTGKASYFLKSVNGNDQRRINKTWGNSAFTFYQLGFKFNFVRKKHNLWI